MTARFANARMKESDIVAGSYFGYHLTTALLGAADADGDGRVSWSEAVRWSVARTAKMVPLAPAASDVPEIPAEPPGPVLSDLAARGEGLLLPAAAPEGPYYVIDGRGAVYAEVMKEAGARFLALPPDRLRVGEVKVSSGEVSSLDESRLDNAPFSADPVTGVKTTDTFKRHWSVSVLGGYQASFGVFPHAPLVGGQITLHNVFYPGISVGVDGAYGWATGASPVPTLGELGWASSRVTFGASLFYEFFPDGRWIPFVGAHVSFELFTRTFDDGLRPEQLFSTISPGVVGGLKVRLISNFSALATARIKYLHYDVDAVRPTGMAEFFLSLNYEFR